MAHSPSVRTICQRSSATCAIRRSTTRRGSCCRTWNYWMTVGRGLAPRPDIDASGGGGQAPALRNPVGRVLDSPRMEIAARVVENRPLGRGSFVLVLDGCDALAAARPG